MTWLLDILLRGTTACLGHKAIGSKALEYALNDQRQAAAGGALDLIRRWWLEMCQLEISKTSHPAAPCLISHSLALSLELAEGQGGHISFDFPIPASEWVREAGGRATSLRR